MQAAATATVPDARTVVIDVGIDIARPVEAVFDYCSDHTHEVEWNPKMRRVAKLTAGPVGVGTRYEMKFLPGRPVIAECERFERPRSWAVTGVGSGLRSTLVGQVLPISSGSHLSLHMELETRGPVRALLPLLRRRMPEDLARDIGIIKDTLEGQLGAAVRRPIGRCAQGQD